MAISMRWYLTLGVLVCGVLLAVGPLWGQESAEEQGLAVFREAEARDQGFGDFTAGLEMVLRTGPGQESRRQMRIRTLEVIEDGDKSLVIFDEPRDVKGTALLTFTYKSGAAGEAMKRFMAEASPRQRELLGFPPPGDALWTPAFIQGMAERYPGFDPGPYEEAAGSA